MKNYTQDQLKALFKKEQSKDGLIDVLLDVNARQQKIIESQMKQIDEATDLLKEILARYEQ